MKRTFLFIFTFLLLIRPFSRIAFAEEAAEKSTLSLTDGLPLAEYPLGSYFTKNGRRCTCHNAGNCISSGSRCNCMRFWPTGRYATCEIDLLGVQCIGFARFCQYRLFGFIDYADTANRYYNVLGSSLKAGNWSAADAEKYIKQAGVGGHIRISTHSIVLLSISDTGFVTYECNGKASGSECLVFSRTFTWKSFYQAYGNTTWRYLHMPLPDYLPSKPPATPETITPVSDTTPISTAAPAPLPPITAAPALTSAQPLVSSSPETTPSPTTTASAVSSLPLLPEASPSEPLPPATPSPPAVRSPLLANPYLADGPTHTLPHPYFRQSDVVGKRRR